MKDTPEITPASNPTLIGYQAPLKALQEMYHSHRLPNAILLSGPQGIGKATLAYHFIWSVLSGSQEVSEQSPHVISELDVAFSKIAHGSHPDLRVLSIEANTETTKSVITVDQVRQMQHFLHHTATETDYRIVLVDSADDLNTNAANAMLKLLEEPPKNAFFILISHMPSKLLPTIRSRCHSMKLPSLDAADIKQIVRMFHPEVDDETWGNIIPMVQYSPGKAMEFLRAEGLELYQKLMTFLQEDQPYSIELLQEITTLVLSQKDQAALRWRYFMWSIQYILRQAIIVGEDGKLPTAEIVPGEKRTILGLKNKSEVEKLMNLWNKIMLLERQTQQINLDKKLVLMNICEMLKR